MGAGLEVIASQLLWCQQFKRRSNLYAIAFLSYTFDRCRDRVAAETFYMVKIQT
jgi:hypothetical protein